MIHQRDPEVADRIVVALEGDSHTHALSAASSAGRQLIGVEGVDTSSWHALSLGARPAMREADDFEPGAERHGWQHEASSRVEREHRERRIMPNEKAIVEVSEQSRSWIGSLSHPFQFLLSDRASLVPGVAVAPPPSAPPSFLSLVPVDVATSNRRAWPPSRSVRQSWRWIRHTSRSQCRWKWR